MTEYIDRAELELAFCNADRDVINPSAERGNEEAFSISRVLDIIAEQRKVDVVPVIHCKDCIYYEPYDPDLINQGFTCTNDYGLDVPEDDDFCSQARRKTDNDRIH